MTTKDAGRQRSFGIVFGQYIHGGCWRSGGGQSIKDEGSMQAVRDVIDASYNDNEGANRLEDQDD
jgi:hypothetical protein